MNIGSKLKVLILVSLFIGITTNARAEEDKSLSLNERMIRLETKIEEGFKAVNQRIDSLEKRIDRLETRMDRLETRMDRLDARMDNSINILIGGFLVIFTGIFSLIGFILWDRRTVVAPVARELKEVVKQKELILEVLKRYSRAEPRLAEAIRAVGLT